MSKVIVDKRERLLDKIQKLRLKAESCAANRSEAEATAFAEQIQRLITEHKVTEAELRGNSVDSQEIIHYKVPHGGFVKYAGLKSKASGFPLKNKRVFWSEQLACIVARGHYCRAGIVYGANSIIFIGVESDAKTASETFCYLVALAEEIAWVEYQKHYDQCLARGNVHEARGYRQSFLLGFVSRLATRYSERMRAIQEEYRENHTALMVISDALARVDSFIESSSALKSVKRDTYKVQAVRNEQGFKDGVKTVNSMALTDRGRALS